MGSHWVRHSYPMENLTRHPLSSGSLLLTFEEFTLCRIIFLNRHQLLLVHTYIHTHIHTYMHTCIHAYMHTCIHAYMHTCIHAYMHTCIHAYMHTCIHAYWHTGILAYWHTGTLAYWYTGILASFYLQPREAFALQPVNDVDSSPEYDLRACTTNFKSSKVCYSESQYLQVIIHWTWRFIALYSFKPGAILRLVIIRLGPRLNWTIDQVCRSPVNWSGMQKPSKLVRYAEAQYIGQVCRSPVNWSGMQKPSKLVIEPDICESNRCIRGSVPLWLDFTRKICATVNKCDQNAPFEKLSALLVAVHDRNHENRGDWKQTLEVSLGKCQGYYKGDVITLHWDNESH